MNSEPNRPPSDPNAPPEPRLTRDQAPQSSTGSARQPQNASSPGYVDGFKEDVESFRKSAARYTSARAQLFGIEAQEAAQELGGAAARLAGAAFFGVIFHLLLLAGVIGLAERYRPGTWPVATLIIAAAHLLIALILFSIGKRRLKNPDRFCETIKQFEHDREWINTTTKKN